MKIRSQFGNILNPKEKGQKIIAHVVNDHGTWGKNIMANCLGRRWPTTRNSYLSKFLNAEGIELGKVQFVPVGMDKIVANMVAQHGITKGGDVYVDLKALADCLEVVKYKAKMLGASVLVQLNGLTGSDETVIVKLLSDCFAQSPTDMAIYTDLLSDFERVKGLLNALEPVAEPPAVKPEDKLAEEPVEEPVAEPVKPNDEKPVETSKAEVPKVEVPKVETPPVVPKVEEKIVEKTDGDKTEQKPKSGTDTTPATTVPDTQPINPNVEQAVSAGAEAKKDQK